MDCKVCMKKIRASTANALLIFITFAMVTGCQNAAIKQTVQTANYGYMIGANGRVHGIDVIFKNGTSEFYPGNGGALGGGWEDPSDPGSLPQSGATYARIGKKIIPKTIYARWFSYRKQKYFAATIHVSESLPKLIEQYSAAYGENTAQPYIILGLGENGEIRASLEVSCDYFYVCGKSRKISRIASSQGQEVEGDPKIYLPITKQLIKQGILKPILGIED